MFVVYDPFYILGICTERFFWNKVRKRWFFYLFDGCSFQNDSLSSWLNRLSIIGRQNVKYTSENTSQKNEKISLV